MLWGDIIGLNLSIEISRLVSGYDRRPIRNISILLYGTRGVHIKQKILSFSHSFSICTLQYNFDYIQSFRMRGGRQYVLYIIRTAQTHDAGVIFMFVSKVPVKTYEVVLHFDPSH